MAIEQVDIPVPNGSAVILDPIPPLPGPLTSHQIATELVHDIVNQAVTGRNSHHFV